MKRVILNFWKDEKGQDIVEYSLLLVLIGAAALIIITQMGVSINNIFSKISGKLEEADKVISYVKTEGTN